MNNNTGCSHCLSSSPPIYTTLDPQFIACEVRKHYGGEISTVTLLQRGANDIYLVKRPFDTLIFRLSTPGTLVTQVLYEVAHLKHLSRCGVSIAAPVAKTDGGFVHHISAAEGVRFAVMFLYAAGNQPDLRCDLAAARELGRTLAAVHIATESKSIESHESNTRYDIYNIIQKPLSKLIPILSGFPAERAYLERFSLKLVRQLEAFPKGTTSYGFCHGDINESNCHLHKDRIMIFDFAFCGHGYRAYDLAAVRAVCRRVKYPDCTWESFVHGYQELRAIPDNEMRMIWAFIPAHIIWYMAMLLDHAPFLGCSIISNGRIMSLVGEMLEWERDNKMLQASQGS